MDDMEQWKETTSSDLVNAIRVSEPLYSWTPISFEIPKQSWKPISIAEFAQNIRPQAPKAAPDYRMHENPEFPMILLPKIPDIRDNIYNVEMPAYPAYHLPTAIDPDIFTGYHL